MADLSTLFSIAARCEGDGNFGPLHDALRAADFRDPRVALLAAMLAQREGRAKDAERHFRVATRAADFVDAHVAFATFLGQQGRHADVHAVLAPVARRLPDHPAVQLNLAIAAHQLGRHDEARQAYERAAGASNDPRAYLYLARLHLAVGEFRAAEAAAAKALSLAPMPEAARLAAQAMLSGGRRAEAIGLLSDAVARWPAFLPALAAQLGRLLLAEGRQDEGFDVLGRGLAAAPDNRAIRVTLATALPPIPASAAHIEELRARYLEQVGAATATVVPGGEVTAGCGTFLLAYHARDDRRHRAAYAGLMRAANPEIGFVAPRCRAPSRPRQRPRVGFFSPHFFDHTIADLFGRMATGLDPKRFDGVLFLPPGPEDRMRARLRAEARRTVEVPLDLKAARERIAQAELDLLIHLDIGMHDYWDLLPHSRLAPRQAFLWGHPETTAMRAMDAAVSVACMEPDDAREHYWEHLFLLPGSGCLFSPVEGIPYDAPPLERGALGLPATGALYLCPQAVFKVHPDFDAALAALLRADPHGHLVLLAVPSRAMASALVARLAAAMPDVAGRIHVLPAVPKADYPRLLATADVLLDAFHYSGGHTTLNALAAGMPTVTLPGAFMRGRHTAGFYALMGSDMLVARDPDDYVRIATAAANDPATRNRARAFIRDSRRTVLEDGQALPALEAMIPEILAMPIRT